MARIRARNSMISGLLLALLAGTGAFAQCPKYRIVNLGSLSTASEAWAINDEGQIVGQSNTAVFGVMHAFFWDNAGCVGNCMKDLGTLPGGTISIARDVNNYSEIVGESEAVIQGVTVTRATYWAAPLPASPQDLGTMSIDSNAQSAAWSINDDSLVAGWTDTDLDCPEDPLVELVRAFHKQQPGGAMTLLPEPAGGFVNPNRDSAAYALNDTATPPEGFGPVTAGEGSPCGANSDIFCVADEASDAIAWQPFAPFGVHDLASPPTFGDGIGQARDVNNLNQLVGWGRQQGVLCHDRALFWPAVTSVPADLHDLVDLPEGEESVAEALNESDEVVGTYVALPGADGARACIWTLQEQQWVFADLSDEINDDCRGNPRWEVLLEARDINEFGWIVGKGEFDSRSRGFLLIPIATCLWDIAPDGGNGSVDVNDLLLILGTWGPCNPPNGICLGDFDCSADVGNTDLLEVLGRYGQSCTALCGGSTASFGGGSETSAADFEWAIMILGVSSVEEFSAWMDGASESEVAVMIEILAALLSP